MQYDEDPWESGSPGVLRVSVSHLAALRWMARHSCNPLLRGSGETPTIAATTGIEFAARHTLKPVNCLLRRNHLILTTHEEGAR